VKFSCERCGKRYATAEPPAPRLYKIKCRACGHVIVLNLAVAPPRAPRQGSNGAPANEPQLGPEATQPAPQLAEATPHAVPDASGDDPFAGFPRGGGEEAGEGAARTPTGAWSAVVPPVPSTAGPEPEVPGDATLAAGIPERAPSAPRAKRRLPLALLLLAAALAIAAGVAFLLGGI
jgi:hypothetical protein